MKAFSKEEERERLEDIIDYPPKGCSGQA